MNRLDTVKQYYASFGEREWLRLTDSPDGYVEFAITCRQIASCLVPGSRVLDVGGGPGRYAIWLAEHGHRVVLADLSPELLEIAKTNIKASSAGNRIEEICETDARDLSRWPNESFDAVLCLGPFYHLPKEEDRSQVTREIVRVLKPRGFLFAAFMPRLGFLRRTLAIANERHHFQNDEWLKSLLKRGEFQNSSPGRFTHGYGIDPSDISPYFTRLGFDPISLLSAESVAGGIPHELSTLFHANRALHDRIIETLHAVASDPSILGSDGHLLFTGQKR